jgi:hypothetical protein
MIGTAHRGTNFKTLINPSQSPVNPRTIPPAIGYFGQQWAHL